VIGIAVEHLRRRCDTSWPANKSPRASWRATSAHVADHLRARSGLAPPPLCAGRTSGREREGTGVLRVGARAHANDICGWGQHGDITRQLFTIVNLRHDH